MVFHSPLISMSRGIKFELVSMRIKKHLVVKLPLSLKRGPWKRSSKSSANKILDFRHALEIIQHGVKFWTSFSRCWRRNPPLPREVSERG
jgi:hypothetical protein